MGAAGQRQRPDRPLAEGYTDDRPAVLAPVRALSGPACARGAVVSAEARGQLSLALAYASLLPGRTPLILLRDAPARAKATWAPQSWPLLLARHWA